MIILHPLFPSSLSPLVSVSTSNFTGPEEDQGKVKLFERSVQIRVCPKLERARAGKTMFFVSVDFWFSRHTMNSLSTISSARVRHTDNHRDTQNNNNNKQENGQQQEQPTRAVNRFSGTALFIAKDM